jgi:mono/diheme cytochrome c family protein
MNRILVVAWVLGLGMSGALAHAADRSAAGAPKLPAGWTFTFPEGNPVSGEKVWEELQCNTCHTIAGAPAARGGLGAIGPELSGYGVLPREYLAESIIKAHTVVAAPGYVVEKGKATMGNYNHFLTVQELIDLVAFLRTKGPSTTMER